jgi:hypothetical protein
MVLYSFGDQGNWIIVAGIYHAANLENNPAALCKSMCDNRFCETINSESRITIVAHGDKGIINGCNANEVLQYLEDIGLSKDYEGIIDIFSCFSGSWNVEGDEIKESIVDAISDVFTKATVIGSVGPTIVDTTGQKHYVKPDAAVVNKAGKIQEDLMTDAIRNFDKTLDLTQNFYTQGKQICQDTTNFYNEFLSTLYNEQLMLTQEEGMVIRQG